MICIYKDQNCASYIILCDTVWMRKLDFERSRIGKVLRLLKAGIKEDFSEYHRQLRKETNGSWNKLKEWSKDPPSPKKPSLYKELLVADIFQPVARAQGVMKRAWLIKPWRNACSNETSNVVMGQGNCMKREVTSAGSMYLCMYVYVYACVCMHMHVYVYTYIQGFFLS